jgi:hypothetical protein
MPWPAPRGRRHQRAGRKAGEGGVGVALHGGVVSRDSSTVIASRDAPISFGVASFFFTQQPFAGLPMRRDAD